MDAEVTFGKRIHNCDTLRLKFVRESIEDCSSASLDGSFKGAPDSINIIQQMERDAIKANKNVVSQFACVLRFIQGCPQGIP